MEPIKEQSPGQLYLVATPLGNLEDITYRALRILSEVDLIAAEDTRQALKLLNHFQIKKKLLSYYQYNEKEQTQNIIDQLRGGKNIALVSDAGMPGISDPGSYLVAAAIKKQIKVVPIPGATAVVTALVASGLDTTHFYFEGFLPRKKKEQQQRLMEIKKYQSTLVFYEAPHRIIATLKNIREILGEREVVVARELTKIHEEFLRGKISEIIEKLRENRIRGEFTLIVEGNLQSEANDSLEKRTELAEPLDLKRLLQEAEGKTLRAKLRNIAARTGKNTKEIYQLYLEINDQENKE